MTHSYKHVLFTYMGTFSVANTREFLLPPIFLIWNCC